jgi:hypothetical protein
LALRALLLASTKGGGADVSGTVEVTLNGAPVERLVITPDNNDLLHQFTLDAKPSRAVGIRFTGKGGLAYQVAGRYFVPWDVKPEDEAPSIDVAYDRARLAQDDIATATATVRNNLGETANMVMIDLGIPPGFDLLTEDLQDYQAKTSAQRGGRLEKFSVTATQAILYFDSIGARDTVTVRFRLRAKYPIRTRTFQSRVYEYRQPEVNSIARPVQLDLRERAKIRSMRLSHWLLALAIAASTLAAADAVHCPSTIEVKQQLAAPAPGWSVTSDRMPHQLAGVTFFDGKPEEKASLAPDKQVVIKGKSVASWAFDGSARPIWVACQYAGTNVVLTRELPRSTRTCSITYTTGVTIVGLPVIEKVDCR